MSGTQNARMDRGNLSRQSTGAVVFTVANEGTLLVWERPRVGCRYLLSVRPGGKLVLVGGRKEPARSVLLVLRSGYLEQAGSNREWVRTRLVARLVAPSLLEATPLAELTNRVADWYGRAIAFVEVCDGAFCAKEALRLGCEVSKREVLDRMSSKWTEEIGWLSDDENAKAALEVLRNAVRESGEQGAREDSKLGAPRSTLALQIECDHLLAELDAFRDEESDLPAVSHDDDVRALATGLCNLEAATEIKRGTRLRQPPEDGWKVVQNFRG